MKYRNYQPLLFAVLFLLCGERTVVLGQFFGPTGGKFELADDVQIDKVEGTVSNTARTGEIVLGRRKMGRRRPKLCGNSWKARTKN